MRILFDPEKPIEKQLGDCLQSEVLDTDYTVKCIYDLYLWEPYFHEGRKIADLYLWEIITSYEYTEDNGIPYHRLDLDPFLTEYIHSDKEFNIFIDLLEIIFSDIKSVADVFDRLSDVNNAPDIFLPKLGALLAYKYRYDQQTDVNRDIIKRLLWVYEGKGTDQDILDVADFGYNPDWYARTFFLPGADVNERMAELFYPVHRLFTHNVSGHSRTDYYQDPVTYRDGVLVLTLLKQVTPELREAMRKVVPAGIRVLYSITHEFSGDTENDSDTGRGGLLVFGAWFRYAVRSYVLEYFMNIDDTDVHGTSYFDGSNKYFDHVFSGKQVFFRDFFLEYKNVASYIPIYIENYFGNLTLNYLPDVIEDEQPPEPQLDNSLPISFSVSDYPILAQHEEYSLDFIKTTDIGVYSTESAIRDELAARYVNYAFPSPDGLEAIDREFAYGVTSYSSGLGESVLNKAPLQELLDDIREALDEVTPTDDPLGYPTGIQFVPVDIYDALKDEYDRALELLDVFESQFDIERVKRGIVQKFTEFLNSIRTYVIDADALVTLIKRCQADLLGVFPSDNSSGFSKGQKYAPIVIYRKFKIAIQAARDLLKTEFSIEQLETQYNELLATRDEFLAAVVTVESDKWPYVEPPKYVFPTTAEFDALDREFLYGESKYDMGVGEPVLNKDALRSLIEEVLDALGSVFATDDPTGGFDGMLWVPTDVYDELNDACTAAQDVLERAKTQGEIENAITDMLPKYNKFKESIQTYHVEVRNLGSYRLGENVKVTKTLQFLTDYYMHTYSDYRYFGDIDFYETYLFYNGISQVSIRDFWSYMPWEPRFKFAPYTENPIHDLDYFSPDYEAKRLWRGVPIHSVNAGFSGKYRYGGENNFIVREYPVGEIRPQDKYYPVKAIEHLYVNQWVDDPYTLIHYNDGITTARESYMKPIEQFKDDDLVDVHGKATLFSELSQEQLDELSVDGLLMFTMSNEYYRDYTGPIEVDLV